MTQIRFGLAQVPFGWKDKPEDCPFISIPPLLWECVLGIDTMCEGVQGVWYEYRPFEEPKGVFWSMEIAGDTIMKRGILE